MSAPGYSGGSLTSGSRRRLLSWYVPSLVCHLFAQFSINASTSDCATVSLSDSAFNSFLKLKTNGSPCSLNCAIQSWHCFVFRGKVPTFRKTFNVFNASVFSHPFPSAAFAVLVFRFFCFLDVLFWADFWRQKVLQLCKGIGQTNRSTPPVRLLNLCFPSSSCKVAISQPLLSQPSFKAAIAQPLLSQPQF